MSIMTEELFRDGDLIRTVGREGVAAARLALGKARRPEPVKSLRRAG